MIRRIYIEFGETNPYFIKDAVTEYQIFAEDFLGDVTDITDDAQIFSMDETIKVDSALKRLSFVKTGSGVIKFTYENSQGFFAGQKEFIVYETFFRDQYLNYFVSDFERDKITANPVYKAIMDTMMEYLDIIYAYNEDIKVLKNFNQTRSKYLEQLGTSMGFPKIDQLNENTVQEPIYESFYRELLSNLTELMSIVGTKTAYDLFFNALGYDIKLEEFWFDSDGNLVEISPYDFVVSPENPNGAQLSTFYRYNVEGVAIDEPPIPRPDPRQFANPDNDAKVNSKSNYVRPIVSVRPGYEDLVEEPGSFTPQKRQIFKKYLELLRPQHIKYLEELLRIQLGIENVPALSEDYGFSRLIIPGTDPDDPELYAPPLQDIIGVNLLSFPEKFFLTPIFAVSDDFEFFVCWDTEGLIWDLEEITDGVRKLNWDQTQFITEKITFNLIA